MCAHGRCLAWILARLKLTVKGGFGRSVAARMLMCTNPRQSAPRRFLARGAGVLRSGYAASRRPRRRSASARVVATHQVKPTLRTKCPSLRLSTPPPAQWTMNASKMMARTMTTTQKKNTMMPGMAYPATLLALATSASYPTPRDLFDAVFDDGQHRLLAGVATPNVLTTYGRSPRLAPPANASIDSTRGGSVSDE